MQVQVRGGVGAGGDVSHNAIGPHSQVIDKREYHIHPRAGEVSWPLEIGVMPALASAFQPRALLREQINAARAGSAAVMTQVLSGGGGVGKSQLAAAYAAEALENGHADLVLWAAAGEAQQVIGLYAQAAALVAAPGANGADIEADAQAFLSWLATTPRRWLVVLDDITDPTAIEAWWPASRTGTGWVLATTRLHDACLTGGGRVRINVDVYSPDEAADYFQTRLAGDDAAHLIDAADELAEALGYLPLALGHAAAYMINQDLDCGEYLARFTSNRHRLDQMLPVSADTEGYGRQVAAALLLSLDAAQNSEPMGLARPALQLVALLDPAGHPQTLWNTPAVLDYLTQQRSSPAKRKRRASRKVPVTADQAHAVLQTLRRYALLACDKRHEPRAVRLHALTGQAVREITPSADFPALATTVANALLRIWPDPDQPNRDLAAVLRTNTDALAGHARDHLWRPEGHPVLYRAGRSLLDAGLDAAATVYWQDITADSERNLGPEHPDTLIARNNLALSYLRTGQIDNALAIQEQSLIQSERVLGSGHPETLTAQANLAISYAEAGRIDEAITLQEEGLVAGYEHVLGPDHPNTLTARANLAALYAKAGRIDEAVGIEEQVLVDKERVLGPEHPDTLTARNNLATTYAQTGNASKTVGLLKQVLVGRERVLGPDHPETLAARANLGAFHAQVGRAEEALPLQEQALADRERVLGPEHPDTRVTRAKLATTYWQAGRTREAIKLQERVLADRERVLGPDHPDTRTARENLAAAYRQAKRIGDSH
ncbi:tetratricopeptide repeat protein [Streptomyces sp. 6-11-2]|uniref:tetratricopeptide repeat protein n=1 Tax=Streptomyces sp. 6-11-2 TaxID=2585753 RepID=UPI001141496D|nr:tetratricopeptide repeat protein [Streptomyces sp. 6-11-2]GED90801.1 tetratricopeptide repeat protein [Streptomyces sp. 6-11-2]